jgi:hypothetical protein
MYWERLNWRGLCHSQFKFLLYNTPLIVTVLADSGSRYLGDSFWPAEGADAMIALNDRQEAIRDEGQKAYPNECCGVALGHIDIMADGRELRQVEGIILIDNKREASEQYHRFRIEPEYLTSWRLTENRILFEEKTLWQ